MAGGPTIEMNEAASAAVRFCPHCGFDLEALGPLSSGLFHYEPKGDLRFGGSIIPLTMAEHIIVGTLMAASPNVVAKSVIAERIDYNGDGNVVDVLLARIRAKLKKATAPNPIVTEYGRGVRWQVAV